ncbi:MAG: phosphoribosylformylglycinamidine synthase subunit PurS [Bdellovibrionaceae bacterium]|nr:phosphoribosylformylglycinamidine synthase subunit PurS [Pseudobdellovibrionaceae bacterium]
MKVGVKVLPRKEILDTQGRAVESVLHQQGQEGVNCRIGKYIELEVPGQNKEEVSAQVKKMVNNLLYNPLIETYELEFYE